MKWRRRVTYVTYYNTWEGKTIACFSPNPRSQVGAYCYRPGPASMGRIVRLANRLASENKATLRAFPAPPGWPGWVLSHIAREA